MIRSYYNHLFTKEVVPLYSVSKNKRRLTILRNVQRKNCAWAQIGNLFNCFNRFCHNYNSTFSRKRLKPEYQETSTR